MIKKIREYMECHDMIEKGDSIIVGISGGADSICLFFVLLELRKELDLTLHAVHVNHNLRGEEALRDQKYVEGLCESVGVPLTIVSQQVGRIARERRISVEEAGRELRREAFLEKMEEVGATKIALAHHCNDNAETLLFHLARGTGSQGMRGVLPKNKQWIRPLLLLEKQEILAYLQGKNHAYCIDSSNMDNVYTRNKIRNCILPLLEEINPRAVRHIGEAIEDIRQMDELVMDLVNQAYKKYVQEEIDERSFLISSDLFGEKEMIQLRVLKLVLEKSANCQKDIGRRHIRAVKKLIGLQVGRQMELPYGVRVYRVYEGIRVMRGENKENKSSDKSCEVGVSLQIPGITKLPNGDVLTAKILENPATESFTETLYTKYFECDIMNYNAEIRTRKSGDYLIFNSQGDKTKLKKYFINEKVPNVIRDEIYNIVIGQEVLWVLGYRKSAAYGVKDYKKSFIQLEWKRDKENTKWKKSE